MNPRPLSVGRHRLETKRIFARWNHVQSYGMAIPAGVHVLGLKPCAQARIENFRLSLPEIGLQPALDPKVVYLQFNGGDVSGKITPDVIGTDEQSRESAAFTLCFDYHLAPALQRGCCFQSRESGNAKPPVDQSRTVMRFPFRNSSTWKVSLGIVCTAFVALLITQSSCSQSRAGLWNFNCDAERTEGVAKPELTELYHFSTGLASEFQDELLMKRSSTSRISGSLAHLCDLELIHCNAQGMGHFLLLVWGNSIE